MADARLEAFGVKNLRCLTDTGPVPIKPLTLLVGRNSSGKSTFLRAFPLLRQSVLVPRRSPILWSHPSYVDFGSLEIAASEHARDRGVTFSFAARLDGDGLLGAPRCELSTTLAPGEGGAYVRAYDVAVDGRAAHISFDPDRRVTQLLVDGRDALASSGLWLAGTAWLIPPVDADEDVRLAYVPFLDRSEGSRWADRPDLSLAPPLPAEPTHDVLPARLPAILAAFDSLVADFASRVAYLGPRRAVGERQYTHSEVAVDEVLPRGENLPQLLASLDPEQMARLSAFTRESLGFELRVRSQGLNIELLIRQSGAAGYQNIADVGFGYAEVLPLCVSIWLSTSETGLNRPRTSVLALEQPELHLHPAHQARLARVLASAVRTGSAQEPRTSLLVETHSEALVNGLGMLVRERQIDPEDIQIVLFDQDPSTRTTTLRFAGYRESGALRDWPFGFLAPTADRLEDIADMAAEED